MWTCWMMRRRVAGAIWIYIFQKPEDSLRVNTWSMDQSLSWLCNQILINSIKMNVENRLGSKTNTKLMKKSIKNEYESDATLKMHDSVCANGVWSYEVKQCMHAWIARKRKACGEHSIDINLWLQISYFWLCVLWLYDFHLVSSE